MQLCYSRGKRQTPETSTCCCCAVQLQTGIPADTEPRSALAERVLDFGATINIVDVSKDARCGTDLDRAVFCTKRGDPVQRQNVMAGCIIGSCAVC